MSEPRLGADPPPGDNAPGADPPRRFSYVEWRKPYWERRKERIRLEIERNRRGEPAIPTWVLVVILIALVGGWAALVVFA